MRRGSHHEQDNEQVFARGPRPRLPDMSALTAELLSESDRAAVILAASLLDDLLANTIAMKMPWDIQVGDVDEIFRFEGPLGSFSARLEIANLFGVIDNDTYGQLSTLREMRNACAHSKHKVSFQDTEVRNVALRMFGASFIAPEFAARELKAAFVLEVSFLAIALSHGREQAFKRCREEHMKFAASYTSRIKPE